MREESKSAVVTVVFILFTIAMVAVGVSSCSNQVSRDARNEARLERIATALEKRAP